MNHGAAFVKTLVPLLVLVAATNAEAEPTSLLLPAGLMLTFEAPPMKKISEEKKGGSYRYVASSAGSADERFNLSVMVEPIDCKFGASVKDVTRCFLEKSDSLPGLVKQSRTTTCGTTGCSVGYATADQMHVHVIFVHGKDWADVHLSVTKPTTADTEAVQRFQGSLVYQDTECHADYGCTEEASATHDIGGGATITLPAGWKFYRYPSPPEPEGYTVMRMMKDGVVIAIDGIPIGDRTVTEEQVEELVREGMQQHVERSKERQVNYVSISHGDLLGGYASLTSPDGTRPFNVIGTDTHASVTTVITYLKQMIFSVSIASTRAPDKDFQDALDAVRNMQ